MSRLDPLFLHALSAATLTSVLPASTPHAPTSVSLPDSRITVRADQHKRNHTGLPPIIHPIVDRTPLHEHITRLEMHDRIVHFHVDFTRHHHRVINAVSPMIAGCSAGLKFNDPEHGAICDSGADVARPLIFVI